MRYIIMKHRKGAKWLQLECGWVDWRGLAEKNDPCWAPKKEVSRADLYQQEAILPVDEENEAALASFSAHVRRKSGSCDAKCRAAPCHVSLASSPRPAIACG